MAYHWSDSTDSLDWDELAALYRAAPLGNKTPEGLKTAFGNSMFRCFVYDKGALVGVGRVLADGVDCAYVCDVALWAAAGFKDTLLRWSMKQEIANGNEKAVQSGVQG